jgi:hypothetical protein
LDASISNSSIKNNIFYNPQGGRTIEAAGFGGSITIADNITSGSDMDDQSGTPPGMLLSNNRLSTNAQLVNPLSPPYDFHLLASSPAINTGSFSSELDFDGVARPVGAGFDIGAYEFGGGTSNNIYKIKWRWGGQVYPDSHAGMNILNNTLLAFTNQCYKLPTDHKGKARPQGGGYDVAAYQFSLSGISSPSNIGMSFIAFNPIRVLSGDVSQGPLTLTGSSPPGKSPKNRR